MSSPVLQTWCVWHDWATEEPLAIEADAVTPALREAWSHEHLTVHTVEAPDRKAAVQQVFPKPPRALPTPSRPRFH
jgi:hypothetical protein